MQLKGKMLLCYELAEIPASGADKQNHQHKQHLLNSPGRFHPASLPPWGLDGPSPSFLSTCRAQISTVNLLTRERGRISVLGGCACVNVWWIFSALIQVWILLLPLGAQHWLQCPRKPSLSPASCTVSVTWQVMSQDSIIWYFSISIPVKGEAVSLNGKCCKNCQGRAGTGESNSRAAEREGEAGLHPWCSCCMLIQVEIVFHEPGLLLMLNLQLTFIFSAVVPWLRGTQGAAALKVKWVNHSQTELCFMTLAIIFVIIIY